jgi:hypothetical protein
MRTRFIVVVLFLWFARAATGQTPDTLQPTMALPMTARLAASDNLGQLYVFTSSYAFEKYSTDLRFLARYTNNRLGYPSAIDATNPMKLLLWYADFRTVVFLDRNLTVLGELNLIQAGYPEVRTVASARDGNLWIYDEVAFKLRKITPEGHVMFESQDLNLLFNTRLNITCLYENDAALYASDAQQGLLQFDNYAQFNRVLPWTGIEQFAIDGKLLYHLQDNTLQVKLIDGFRTAHHVLPDLPFTKRWLGHRAVLRQEGAMLVKYGF